MRACMCVCLFVNICSVCRYPGAGREGQDPVVAASGSSSLCPGQVGRHCEYFGDSQTHREALRLGGETCIVVNPAGLGFSQEFSAVLVKVLLLYIS